MCECASGATHREPMHPARLASLGGAVIENWAAHLRKEGYSPASIRREMVALRVFCSYWFRRGAGRISLLASQLSFGRIEQLPRALTEGEMRALIGQGRKDYSTAAAEADGSEANADQPEQASTRGYRVLRNLAIRSLRIRHLPSAIKAFDQVPRLFLLTF